MGGIHVVVMIGQRCRAEDGEDRVTGSYIDVTDEFDADLQHTVDELVEGLARLLLTSLRGGDC
jgi:hypothetical protein